PSGGSIFTTAAPSCWRLATASGPGRLTARFRTRISCSGFTLLQPPDSSVPRSLPTTSYPYSLIAASTEVGTALTGVYGRVNHVAFHLQQRTESSRLALIVRFAIASTTHWLPECCALISGACSRKPSTGPRFAITSHSTSGIG